MGARFERILAAVDDSPRARGVLAAAVDLARLAGATLRVYTAIAVPPDLAPAVATSHGDPLPAYLHRVAEARLLGLLASLPPVDHEIVVEESHRPAASILDAAAAYRADLIVVGSHGYGGLDRILGTVAGTIANTSPIDVYVVHRQAAGAS